ncbi:MAG: TonB-dependent receptor plug domain-containing protein [Lentisphaeraceae bacterium]|nr:TonB-dependent receptor plug domain-containing protein [Lentisphaeraceae bacterium]
MKTIIYRACLIAVMISAEAFAQKDRYEYSFEELANITISSVSRIDENLDKSPGTIYSISSEKIHARGYRNLRELLNNIPGFIVFHRDLQYVANIRGLASNDNEKITLLINGQELNGVFEPDILNGPINLDNVERVEVIVGPSSLFQQANTLAATVNVITKRMDGGPYVSISSGNYLKKSVTLSLGSVWAEDTFVSTTLSTESYRGFDAWDSESLALFQPLKHREITANQEGYTWITEAAFNEWYAQIVLYESQFSELQLEGYGNNTSIYTDTIYSLLIKNEHQWSDDLTSIISLSGAYKKTFREVTNGYPTAGGIEISNGQYDYTAEAAIHYRGFENHFIQTGLQYAYEDHFDTFYTIVDPTPREITFFDTNSYAIGVYLSDDWKINDQLSFVNGIRVDKNTIIDDQERHWGGRTALVYSYSPEWITKLMYNVAVRIPSPLAGLNEAWGIDAANAPDWAKGAIAEKPETLGTLEWQNIFYLDETRMSLTLYYQKLKNFISWAGPHTNVGDFEGSGVEFELRHQTTNNIENWFNLNYINSSFDSSVPQSQDFHIVIDNNDQLIGSPELVVNIGSDIHLSKDIVFTPRVRYFTRQSAYSVTKDKFIKIDDRYYFDFGLLWKDIFAERLNMRISAVNLFNNRKHVAGQWLSGLYKPRGTTFTITLSYTF